MATGDFTLFQELSKHLGEEQHDFSNDTFKLGIVDNTLTPDATGVGQAWDTYSANEVATTGGYTAGGETLANTSYSKSGAVTTFDGDDVELAQNASGFTDAYWGILYNDTNALDFAIGFVELGGPLSEVAAAITVQWNASGILTVTTEV